MVKVNNKKTLKVKKKTVNLKSKAVKKKAVKKKAVKKKAVKKKAVKKKAVKKKAVKKKVVKKKVVKKKVVKKKAVKRVAKQKAVKKKTTRKKEVKKKARKRVSRKKILMEDIYSIINKAQFGKRKITFVTDLADAPTIENNIKDVELKYDKVEMKTQVVFTLYPNEKKYDEVMDTIHFDIMDDEIPDIGQIFG